MYHFDSATVWKIEKCTTASSMFCLFFVFLALSDNDVVLK